MNELISAALIKGEIEKFRFSIENFNSQTAIQNKRMLILTLVITFLTLIMLIAVCTQIYISIYKSNSETEKITIIKPTTSEATTIKVTTPKTKTYNKLLNRIDAKDAPPG